MSPKLLSECRADELSRLSALAAMPKRASMCLLRSLGLPTLDAAFIPIDADHSAIASIAKDCARTFGVDRLMVRADAIHRAANAYRGGKSLSVPEAIREAVTLKDSGLHPFFLEPTNRFANLFSAHLTIDAAGSWTGEALGPGFDSSDLQRGLVPPKWIFGGPPFSNGSDPLCRPTDLRLRVHEASDCQREAARLESIAGLLNFNDRRGKRAQRAREFLRDSGNCLLFSGGQNFNFRCAARLVQDCALVYSYLSHRAHSFPMTIASAILSDRRFIYWDITFGRRKWQENAF